MRAERRQALRDRQRQSVLETLRDAEAWLDGLIDLERRTRFDYAALGLARIRALLAAIGNPERGLACVHVAGSKGKGSTTLAAEALLRARGLRVGAFTSPHLSSWLERFRVGGTPVAEAELLAALRRIQPAIERQRARSRAGAELLRRVDRAGARALPRRAGRCRGRRGRARRAARFDQRRRAARLGRDRDRARAHRQARPHARSDRRREGRHPAPRCAGAVRPAAGEALAVVRARAAEVGAPLREVSARAVEADRNGRALRAARRPARRRAACSARTRRRTSRSRSARRRSSWGPRSSDSELARLEKLELPGRIERFGDVVLDCAHTPDSARALRETLERRRPGRRWVLALCVSRDKDAAAIAASWRRRARRLWPLRPSRSARSLPRELARAGSGRPGSQRWSALPRRSPRWPARANSRGPASGSCSRVVYFAGALRAALLADRAGGPCMAMIRKKHRELSRGLPARPGVPPQGRQDRHGGSLRALHRLLVDDQPAAQERGATRAPTATPDLVVPPGLVMNIVFAQTVEDISRERARQPRVHRHALRRSRSASATRSRPRRRSSASRRRRGTPTAAWSTCRPSARNQHGEVVLTFQRKVQVWKNDSRRQVDEGERRPPRHRRRTRASRLRRDARLQGPRPTSRAPTPTSRISRRATSSSTRAAAW